MTKIPMQAYIGLAGVHYIVIAESLAAPQGSNWLKAAEYVAFVSIPVIIAMLLGPVASGPPWLVTPLTVLVLGAGIAQFIMLAAHLLGRIGALVVVGAIIAAAALVLASLTSGQAT